MNSFNDLPFASGYGQHYTLRSWQNDVRHKELPKHFPRRISYEGPPGADKSWLGAAITPFLTYKYSGKKIGCYGGNLTHPNLEVNLTVDDLAATTVPVDTTSVVALVRTGNNTWEIQNLAVMPTDVIARLLATVTANASGYITAITWYWSGGDIDWPDVFPVTVDGGTTTAFGVPISTSPEPLWSGAGYGYFKPDGSFGIVNDRVLFGYPTAAWSSGTTITLVPCDRDGTAIGAANKTVKLLASGSSYSIVNYDAGGGSAATGCTIPTTAIVAYTVIGDGTAYVVGEPAVVFPSPTDAFFKSISGKLQMRVRFQIGGALSTLSNWLDMIQTTPSKETACTAPGS